MDPTDITETVKLLMIGAIVMASFIISLFFLRFWKSTKDKFFLYFSLSFALEGFGRILLGLTEYPADREPYIYLFRLVAFSIILYAIIEKNLRSKRNSP